MNYPCLIAAISLGVVSVNNAQVKKTYQDTNFSQTTVVVKEEGSEDYDILDAHFDIEEYNVGQVIRIKTEPENAAAAQARVDTGSQEVSEMVIARSYDFASNPGQMTTAAPAQSLTQVETLPVSERPEQTLEMVTTAEQIAAQQEELPETFVQTSASSKAARSVSGSAKAASSQKKTKIYRHRSGSSLKIKLFRIKIRLFQGKKARCFKF
jgi:hypothetical protein